ncbi:MAG: hypothetical protein ACRYGF_06670 [Janthinobacterium lividum]
MSAFIAHRVQAELQTAIKDRNVLETESAISVFEKALGWMKLLATGAGVLLAIVSAVFAWRLHDLSTVVSTAKTTVSQSADAARAEIRGTSTATLKGMQVAAASALVGSQEASRNAAKVSNDLNATATRTKNELNQEAAAVRQSTVASQAALANANKLQPEITSLRSSLDQTTKGLAEQKKLLSSSEEFAKKIFSSRVNAFFDFPPGDANTVALKGATLILKNYAVIPKNADGQGTVVIFILLPSAPIRQTLQLQHGVATQPISSFFTIHNLVIFFWSDPVEVLKQKTLIASYFPDSGDKELIKTLLIKNGRIYADDQPFPKFNEADPTYKGNKWAETLPDGGFLLAPYK